MATLVALLALADSVHVIGSSGGAAVFSGLARLRVLLVLLTLVLVAPPLGGRLSARPAAQAANTALRGVSCLSPSPCLAVGDRGTILRTTDGGNTWRGPVEDWAA
jgi:hypothetical protein